MDEQNGRFHLEDAEEHLESISDDYLEEFSDSHQSKILLALVTLQEVLRDLQAPDNPQEA